MTTYEVISVIISIFSLMTSFGSLVVALLSFLDMREKRK